MLSLPLTYGAERPFQVQSWRRGRDSAWSRRRPKSYAWRTNDQTTADPGLLRILARAHEIQARLLRDTDLTVHVLASQERVSEGYLSRLLRLPSLAPDIITAIVNGKNPPQLTAKKLMRLTLQMPVDWTEQRKLLGFQKAS